LLHALRPQGFDIVIDATGVPSVVERLPDFVRMGGLLIFYGVCPEEAEIHLKPYEIFRRELTIRGSFSQLHTFHRAVALFNQGLINTEGMITHTFPLEAWGEALSLMQQGTEAVKIVMTP
jgi:D-arabinitol dehydrogenase (NADP+)